MKKVSKLLESKKKYNIKKIDFMGYEIYYGKDAISNDHLTFNIGNDEDIWLHVTGGIPGSHVVIKGSNPPIQVIEEAAKIAKLNSKGKDQKVKVIYCQKKYVTKKENMNIGQVLVDHSHAKFIEL